MFDQNQIFAFLTKVLWVVGGFIGGYLFTWMAGVGFDKLVTQRKSPELLHRWARVVGGVIVALVVAFFVFPAGPGSGGGGGAGDNPLQSGKPIGETTPSTAATPPTRKAPEVPVEAAVIRVKVFAGAEVEPGTTKYYELAERPGRKVDVKGVEDAVRQEQRLTDAAVVVVYSFDPTASRRTEGFLQLERESQFWQVPLMSEEQYQKFRNP